MHILFIRISYKGIVSTVSIRYDVPLSLVKSIECYLLFQNTNKKALTKVYCYLIIDLISLYYDDTDPNPGSVVSNTSSIKLT